MNAKLLLAMLAGLFGLVASADVLYWQVNNDAAVANAKGGDYAYALLRATDGESATDGNQYYVNTHLTSSGGSLSGAIAKSVFSDTSTYLGGVLTSESIQLLSGEQTFAGNLSSLSFFIELYDSLGNWVGETSSLQSYQDLVNSGAISGFNANFKGVNAAMGSTGGYRDVPEPTSGLLMLVGLGALALRRRKVA